MARVSSLLKKAASIFRSGERHGSSKRVSSLQPRRLFSEPLEQRQLLSVTNYVAEVDSYEIDPITQMAGDYLVTSGHTDGTLDPGDTVTWRPGETGQRNGLEFGLQAFDSIQLAVNYAVDDDVVLVAPGDYYEHVTVDRDISVVSLTGAANTTIHGQGGHEAVKLQGNPDEPTGGVQFGDTGQGFTVERGGASTAAVYVPGDVSNVLVKGNVMHGDGVKAFLTTGGVSNIVVDGNEMDSTGGQVVYVNGTASLGSVNASYDVDITNNTISGDVGGGLLLGFEAVGGDITGNTFFGSSSYTGLELWGQADAVHGNDLTGFNVSSGSLVLDSGEMHLINDLSNDNTLGPHSYTIGAHEIVRSSSYSVSATTPEETKLSLDVRQPGTYVSKITTGVNTHGTVVIRPTGMIEYTPSNNYVGNASFGYEIRYLNGGALAGTGTVNVNVTAKNDAPVVSAPSSVNAVEETPTTITNIQIYDVDATDDNRFQVELWLASKDADDAFFGEGPFGTLSIVDAHENVDVAIVGDSIVLTGDDATLADFNATLANGIRYQGNEDFFGPDELMIEVTDFNAGGISGSGGQATTTKGVDINVQNTNDPMDLTPTNLEDLETDENATTAITSDDLSFFDPDYPGPGYPGADVLTYVVTEGPTKGDLVLIGKPNVDDGTVVSTFTQADIDQGYLRYKQDGTQPAGAPAGTEYQDYFNFNVSDSTGSPVGTRRFDIIITAVDDAPVVTNNGAQVSEGQSVSINTSKLSASDEESSDADLTYTIEQVPAHGSLKKDGTTVGYHGTFTQADIVAGKIRYVHDGTEPGGYDAKDSFKFTVTDGTTTDVLTFHIDPISEVNDLPRLARNNVLSLFEGATKVISQAELQATDDDNAVAELEYLVTSGVQEGTLRKNGVPIGAGAKFTQKDINDGKIVYVHNGGEGHADSFGFTLHDGDGGVVTGTFVISAIPVNDLPVQTGSAEADVSEGGSVELGPANLNATDAETTNSHLRYTIATEPTKGDLEKEIEVEVTITPDDGDPYTEWQWQWHKFEDLDSYPIRGGSGNHSTTYFTQADVNGNHIRYVHTDTADQPDDDEFTLTLGDLTGGNVTVDFDVNVNPVDDEPELDNNSGRTVTEGASFTFNTDNLWILDGDTEDNAELFYKLKSVPEEGTLKLDGTALGVNGTFTQQDIIDSKVKFFHNGGEITPLSFTFTISDGTTTVTPEGGDAFEFEIVVENVNDDATFSANSPLAVLEGDSVVISRSFLEGFDADLDDVLEYTINTTVSRGELLLEGHSSPLGEGDTFTQEDVDAGRLTYVHDGGEGTSDGFTFDVTEWKYGTNSQPGEVFLGESLAIQIVPQNDNPYITSSLSTSVNEADQNVDIVLRADDDEDGDNLSYSVISGPSDGTLEIWNADLEGYVPLSGSFTQQELYLHDLRYDHDGSEPDGPDKFVFRVADTDGGTTTATFTINIEAQNDDPVVVVNKGAEVDEGDGNKVIIGRNDGTNDFRLVGDDEEDGDDATLLTYHVLSGPSDGDLQIWNPDAEDGDGAWEAIGSHGNQFTQDQLNKGHVRYEHRGGEPDGPDSIDFRLEDDADGSVLGSYEITVNALNDDPVLLDDYNTGAAILEEGEVIIWGDPANPETHDVELISTDEEDNDLNLTYTVTSGPEHGMLMYFDDTAGTSGEFVELTSGSFTQKQLKDGHIKYKHDGTEPDTYDDPEDSFDFVVTDSDGATDSGTFTITIAHVADPPQIVGDLTVEIDEGGVFDMSIASTDEEDNDANLIYSFGTPSLGQLQKWNPDANDGDGKWEALPPGTEVKQSQLGNIRYEHDGDEPIPDNDEDVFSITVTDSEGETDSGQVTITINAVNDAPKVLVNKGATVAEDGIVVIGIDPAGPLDFTLQATDEEDVDSTLTYVPVSAPSAGSVEVRVGGLWTPLTGTVTQAQISAGEVRYVHGGSETTSDNLRFRIQDSDGALSEVVTYTISVDGIPDQTPVAVDDHFTVEEGGSIVPYQVDDEWVYHSLVANDTDADRPKEELSVTSVTVPEHLDAEGETVAAVTYTNFTSDRVDIDLVYGTLTIDTVHNAFEYVHDGSEPTTAETFTYTITDETFESDPATVTIDITPVNDAPKVLVNGSTTVDEDQELDALALSVSDSDSTLLTLELGVSHGTLDVANNPATRLVLTGTAAQINATLENLVYKPALNFNGHDKLETKVRDSQGAVNPEANRTVTITVDAVNDAPNNGDSTLELTGVDALIEDGAPVVIDVDAVSSPGGGVDEAVQKVVIVNVTEQPNGGFVEIDLDANTVTYTPAPDFFGMDTFTYVVEDQLPEDHPGYDTFQPEQSMVTVTVEVKAKNDAPTFTLASSANGSEDAGEITVDEFLTDLSFGPGETGQSVIATNFTIDPDWEDTVGNLHEEGNLTVSIDVETGTLTFEAAENAWGRAWVVMTIQDDGGTEYGGVDTSDGVGFQIQIGQDPNDDAPTVVADVIEVTEGEGIFVLAAQGLLANDTDPDIPAQPGTSAIETDDLRIVSIEAGGSTYDPGEIVPLGDVTLIINEDGSYSVTHSGTEPLEVAPTFNYTIEDSDSHTSTGMVTVQVIGVNEFAPFAQAPADKTGVEGEAIEFVGAVVDADTPDDPVTYTWDFGDGSDPVSIGPDDEGYPAVTHTFPDDGIYTVTLTVDDGVHDPNSDTMLVTIDEAPPTLDLSSNPTTHVESSTQPYLLDVLSGFNEPGEETVKSFLVFWGDGSFSSHTAASVVANSGIISHLYHDQRVATISVTVVEEIDGVDTAFPGLGSHQVTITNAAPTALLINDGPANEGATVTALFVNQQEPSVVDANAGLRYAYDFDNDGTFDVGDGTYAGSVASSSFAVPGDFLNGPAQQTIRGRIIDKDGGYNDYTTLLTVNNVAPTVDAGADATASFGVEFTQQIEITDPGAEGSWDVAIDWTGDGLADETLTTSSKTFDISRTFVDEGSVVVTVWVNDDAALGMDTFTVDVGPDPSYSIDLFGNNITFQYDAVNDDLIVTVDGAVSTYADPENVTGVSLYGVGDASKLYLYGTPGEDIYSGTQGQVSLSLSTGLNVSGTGFDAVRAYGDMNDEAYLMGTAGADKIIAWADRTQMNVDSALSAIVYGFGSVEADVTGSGGNDTADLLDGPGNDVFYANPTEAWMELSSGVVNKVMGFPFVRATAENGGEQDMAYLNDADTFVSRDYGAWSLDLGQTYLNSTRSFEYVEASASTAAATGADPYARAILAGADGDDEFHGTTDESWMVYPAGNVHKSTGFVNNLAVAGTGNDTAHLSGSAGDDTFVAGDGYAYMFDGMGTLNSTRQFDTVVAEVTAEGTDAASLNDTSGADTFYGGLNESRFELASGVVNKAVGAFDTAMAVATAGTGDQAFLSGTAGDDTFVVRADGGGYMSGSGKVNSFRNFDYVEADVSGSGGSDAANMSDDALLTDLFLADADEASFDLGDDGDVEMLARGFSRVNATSSDGDDKKDDDQAYDFALYYYGDGWE